MNSFILAVLGLFLLCQPAYAEEPVKRYNFGVRPHPLISEAEEKSDETVKEEKEDAESKVEDKKDDEKKEAAETVPPAPVAEAPKEAPALVDGVYSPKGKAADAPKTNPKHNHEKSKKAEELVRFFMGSCLKYYGRNKEMIAYMDANFPRLDADRKADFAPVIGGNINTQYWDIARGDVFYMLAKDTSSGKCDIIAKDGASHFVHKELKAVMDGLTITKILMTKTEYEKVASQNKEVSMVSILGHPLEKELAIVATTKIKDIGDNLDAQITLFTVPQETVDVIDVTPKEAAPTATEPAAAGGGFSKD